MAQGLTGLTPMLLCEDVRASIEFYTRVLGLEVVDRMDDVGRSGWASLRLGPVHLMLASPTDVPRAPKVGGRYTQAVHYFYSDDLDGLRERAVAGGGSPTEIEQRFYDMREFELVDPDGHVLVFGQDSPAR